MSNSINQNFVDQFSANVFHLSQQRGSKLRNTVRNESQNGESAFYDRIGATAAVKKTGRHSNTPLIDTPHSRRMVTIEDYEVADLVDKEDKIRMIHDPENDYTIAFMWALGRSIDDILIAAMGGSAYSGQKGTTPVALPDAQKYAANTGSGAFSNLNVRTLRALKRIFDDADVEDTDRYIVCAPSQIEALLGQTEVTNSDYAAVKALVQGEVDSFMGFQFKRITRLLTETGAPTFNATTGVVDGAGSSANGFRKIYAYCKTGVLLAVGASPTGRVSERDDKSYSTQVYASMSMGGTRMEEPKVIECYCKES